MLGSTYPFFWIFLHEKISGEINYTQLPCSFCSACAKPNFLAMTMMAPLLELSLVSMATSMEITFNCSFSIRSFLLGLQGGASSLEVSPNSMDHWNWHAKLGPFFSLLLLTVTFEQMTIKHSLYMSNIQVLFRKGLCGFFPFWDLP